MLESMCYKSLENYQMMISMEMLQDILPATKQTKTKTQNKNPQSPNNSKKKSEKKLATENSGRCLRIFVGISFVAHG